MTEHFTHGSLFSGIGGFDLAAQWMGWENLFHCEWNPFGQRVLNYYWPKAKSFTDITKSDFTPYANKISVLSGGFPCQPYSLAGKRLGKEDDRHLWPEMLRAIGEIQPRWVVGENVFGLLSWNGGMVFDEVQLDLETAFQDSPTARSLYGEGYEVIPFILPACSVNAVHRRDRVWFVARRIERAPGATADTNGSGQPGPGWSKQQGHTAENGNWKKYRTLDDGGRLYESPVCPRNDGLSARLDGITLREWRIESVKAAGNAIVPQVAYQIFKAIQQYEQQHG